MELYFAAICLSRLCFYFFFVSSTSLSSFKTSEKIKFSYRNNVALWDGEERKKEWFCVKRASITCMAYSFATVGPFSEYLYSTKVVSLQQLGSFSTYVRLCCMVLKLRFTRLLCLNEVDKTRLMVFLPFYGAELYNQMHRITHALKGWWKKTLNLGILIKMSFVQLEWTTAYAHISFPNPPLLKIASF